MKQHYKIFILFLFFMVGAEMYSNTDGEKGSDANIYMVNEDLLCPFFDKLYNLEQIKMGKLNIVHIGDSHIQADFFTNTIRQGLQERFGNAGWGLTFPYSLIRTNGTRKIKYISNAQWQGQSVIKKGVNDCVGVNGMAIKTDMSEFVLQLSVEDDKYKFNTLKIIHPNASEHYNVSASAKLLEITKNLQPQIGYKYHKIKSGESLSVIARKYRISITQLKQANGLKSNMIRAGKNLKIPTKVVKVNLPKIGADMGIDLLPSNNTNYCATYQSDTLLSQVMILPDAKQTAYALNGVVLENDSAGIIYHTIGVNGGHISDYNKYPLVFKQLPVLEPDLVIVSFGTNESFGRISTSQYLELLDEFVANIRKYNKETAILVLTPPPSLIHRRRTNSLAMHYSNTLMKTDKYAVWDLFNHFGGLDGVSAKGEYARYITRDKIHYIESGYELQGQMFLVDFMNAYNNFKLSKTN